MAYATAREIELSEIPVIDLAALTAETKEDYLKICSIFAPPGRDFEAVSWHTFGKYLDYCLLAGIRSGRMMNMRIPAKTTTNAAT